MRSVEEGGRGGYGQQPNKLLIDTEPQGGLDGVLHAFDTSSV